LTGLTLSSVSAVLGAALGHAVWNAIAHRITDKEVGFTLVGLGSAICCVPLLITQPLPSLETWPYLAGSIGVHTLYLVFLMRSYRLGDYSHAYPLARGTAPLAVVAFAAVFAGELPSLQTVAGVCVVSVGLGLLVFAGGRLTAKDWPASMSAVCTGLLIAVYTTVDGIGVRASGNVLGYTGWLMFLVSMTVPAYTLVRRREKLLRQIKPVWHVGLAGGAISLAAYGLVLWAQSTTALSAVAALRETSVIMGAVIGTLVFRERFGAVRIVAATLVVAGIVLMSFEQSG
jgi:drug/metabolite transporter (DMT)-like permease